MTDKSTDLRLHLHNAGTAEWVLRIRRMQPEDGLKEMMRISQLCVDALDALERLDADAACERAEKESLKLEVERLRARVQELGVILSAWGISGWESPADMSDSLEQPHADRFVDAITTSGTESESDD